ncbi:MAG TPA: sensor histidine kinase [Opitutaceae bacterium]|nr:sensor histidine kinase [Opitutaceae bacterium]
MGNTLPGQEAALLGQVPEVAQEFHDASAMSPHAHSELIRQANDARQEVLRRMLQTQEHERAKIAHVLHDEVGQYLTAIQLHVRRFLKEKPENIPAIVQMIERMTDALGKEVHELAFQLRPTSLDDLGLERALQNFLEQWSVHSGIATQSSIHLPNTACVPPNVAATVFRIVQEALTNVAQHARATNAVLFVKHDPMALVVIVEDNGHGFDADSESSDVNHRLGLLGMRERAALIGAELTIESSSSGTSVHLRIPLNLLDARDQQPNPND